MMTIRYQIAVRKNGGRALLKSEVLSFNGLDKADHRPVLKFFADGARVVPKTSTASTVEAHLDILGASGTLDEITDEEKVKAAYSELQLLAYECGLVVLGYKAP